MNARVWILVVLVAIGVWQGWLTFLQYTFVPPPPYTVQVCTGRDYGHGSDTAGCAVKATTVTLRDEAAAGALLQVAYKGYHGQHDMSMRVERAQQDGSWTAGSAWFVPGARGDESDPTTWIYRASLTLFWPPPWETHGSGGTVLTLAGTYRLDVAIDGQTLPSYTVTIVP